MVCVTGARADGGTPSEREKAEGRKLLEIGAESPASSARREASPKGAVLGGLIFYYAFCSSAHDGARSRHAGTPRPDRRSGQGRGPVASSVLNSPLSS